ncbi:MAG: ABC transporter permease [Candidatus Cryptobacteroides sp.]|nr:ABC transporter permease [Bacteroidales bacterium]
MNLHIVNIIIKREYLTRVKKKSFIIATFLVPILFAALCTLPSLIMVMAKEEAKKIAVVDQSGIVASALSDTKTVTFTEFSGVDPAAIKASLDSLGMDVLLSISPLDTARKTVNAMTYSGKPLGVDMTGDIERQINDAVEQYRIASYGIDGLEQIMEDVKPDVRLVSYQMDESGNETLSESGLYMMLSLVLGMIIYMFISMFCGMVMSSVIEEKSSRVVEVLVSSVKATELLFGKIVGVAMVALTQFFMWIVLTVLILAVVSGITGAGLMDMGVAADPTAQLSGMTSQLPEGAVPDMSSLIDQTVAPFDSLATQPSEMSVIFSTLKSINYARLIVVFILFFIFGYLLYASLFAAIGSAVENEADSNQLVLPLTVPLMIGFFIAMFVYKAPDSGVVFWASMIPFTSPMVMLTRVLFGVKTWEIVLSLVILIASFFGCAWISAKIYKVGILMFGKKSTFKDLWKWLKMK